MLKFLVLFITALAATTSATSGGYNYQGSESHVVHQAQPASQQHHHDDGYEKHYYSFNAPEEPHHVQHSAPVKKIAPQTVKKNLQVIFIKPPEEKHHPRPVQHIAQQSTVQEKTHIYVLTPEPHHHAPKQVQHIQQAQTVHHHKPEVHYVKYHTPAEAEHLQHSIIQQYGGKPSEIVHSGSAPAVSFINAGHQNVAAPHQHEASASVNRQYLAPAASSPVSLAVEKNVVPGTSYIPPV